MEKVPGAGKPGGHLKSRLAGTTRLIKKVLQPSQYRKTVEALCSQNKKMYPKLPYLPASAGTHAAKVSDIKSETCKINLTTVFTDCKFRKNTGNVLAAMSLLSR
ncbi:hypothetical protein AII24_003501 [Salmonella enterica subsp. enterica]|nr:hypothetical protein [Salmonella enterica subsp. enterica]